MRREAPPAGPRGTGAGGGATNEQLRARLDLIAATPFERAEGAWRAVIAALRLPLAYQPALGAALAKSRWRTAKDPLKYLRTVTCRQARRLGLTDVEGPPPLSGLLLAEQTHGAVVDGEDPRSSGDDEDYLARVDPDLIDPDERCGTVISWDRVAERVPLTQAEIFVIECRSDGLTRRQILEHLAEDDQNRRDLQAAYRRFHDRMPAIRDALAENIFHPKPPRNRARKVLEE